MMRLLTHFHPNVKLKKKRNNNNKFGLYTEYRYSGLMLRYDMDLKVLSIFFILSSEFNFIFSHSPP